MKKTEAFMYGLFAGTFLGCLMVLFSLSLRDQYIRKEAIDAGVAHYNATNANFEWNTPMNLHQD